MRRECTRARCSRAIVYDDRSSWKRGPFPRPLASLRGTRSKEEDTVLSLPLLTRFNDSIRESCRDDFFLPGWSNTVERWSVRDSYTYAYVIAVGRGRRFYSERRIDGCKKFRRVEIKRGKGKSIKERSRKR